MGKSSLALVAWDRLVLPKILGGLNYGNLLHRNISLLFKWIWRFLHHERKAIWRKVIMEKYGYTSTLLAHNLISPIQGGPWKSICASILKHPVASGLLKLKIRKVVGNGSKTLFWTDLWLENVPLKSRFPRLFSISKSPLAYISSLGSWSGHSWTWNFTWATQ